MQVCTFLTKAAVCLWITVFMVRSAGNSDVSPSLNCGTPLVNVGYAVEVRSTTVSCTSPCVDKQLEGADPYSIFSFTDRLCAATLP